VNAPARDQKPRIIRIKKKGGHPAHHGGAWKVAYADFVTAMMALFIVLWLLTQADLETRSQIAQYFRHPGILSGGASAGNPQMGKKPTVVDDDLLLVQKDMQQLARSSEQELLSNEQQRVQKMLADVARESPEMAELAGLTQVKVTSEGLLIEMVDDAGANLFDSASAALKPALAKLLQRLGALLGELPNAVEISGHTDGQKYARGSTRDNWDLSFQRAQAARPLLEAGGLRKGQVTRIMAHADSDLLIPENPLDPRNRRLSILAVRRLPPPDPKPAMPGIKTSTGAGP